MHNSYVTGMTLPSGRNDFVFPKMDSRRNQTAPESPHSDGTHLINRIRLLLVSSLPDSFSTSSIHPKRSLSAASSVNTSRLAILIVGAMPGFCCVSSNKQQRRCNGCPVHSISKRNYEASSRNLSFLTFVSPAFVVSSVLQLSPAQSASRIPKPCDWLRKIRAHAGPDRATVARPDRGEPAPT
jgi:hypothetical protein